MNKVEKILNSGWMAALCITGGGTGIIPRLLENGGGSKFLIDAYVPYGFEQLKMFCYENEITKAVSKDTSIYMAKAMYETLQGKQFSLSCTAKLMSDGERPDREHCAEICICYENKYVNMYFSPTTKTRKLQEDELVEFILDRMLDFIGKKNEWL